jgi:hypothetical protein
MMPMNLSRHNISKLNRFRALLRMTLLPLDRTSLKSEQMNNIYHRFGPWRIAALVGPKSWVS